MGKLLKMAWRNVWRNRRRTVIAVIAIALGLALMLFFDGLLGGTKQAIYGNTLWMASAWRLPFSASGPSPGQSRTWTASVERD